MFNQGRWGNLTSSGLILHQPVPEQKPVHKQILLVDDSSGNGDGTFTLAVTGFGSAIDANIGVEFPAFSAVGDLDCSRSSEGCEGLRSRIPSAVVHSSFFALCPGVADAGQFPSTIKTALQFKSARASVLRS
jgi:hypothetical protein